MQSLDDWLTRYGPAPASEALLVDDLVTNPTLMHQYLLSFANEVLLAIQQMSFARRALQPIAPASPGITPIAVHTAFNLDELKLGGLHTINTSFIGVLALTLVREEQEFLKQIKEIAKRSHFKSLSPTIFSNVRRSLEIWRTKPSLVLFNSDLADDFRSYPDWPGFIQLTPGPKDRAVEGYFGELTGISAYTDGYRYDGLQVLDPGSIFLFGPPKSVGWLSTSDENVSIVRRSNEFILSISWNLSIVLNRPDRAICWAQKTSDEGKSATITLCK